MTVASAGRRKPFSRLASAHQLLVNAGMQVVTGKGL